MKRLTTNDRERMLKSRALPDDFDTTRVLRTPFESHSTGQTPIASPSGFGAPNPDFAALRALRTDLLHRPTDDEYLVSPQSSASATGTYLSSAGQGRTDGLPQSNMMFIRPGASASMSDLHRTIRSDYTVTRSSSLSEASSQPPDFHSGMHLHNRFAGHPNQHGMPYMRQPGRIVPGYEQHRPFERSVSPTDSQDGQMTYEMSSMGMFQRIVQNAKQTLTLLLLSRLTATGLPATTVTAHSVTTARPTLINHARIPTLFIRQPNRVSGPDLLYTRKQCIDHESPNNLRPLRAGISCI